MPATPSPRWLGYGAATAAIVACWGIPVAAQDGCVFGDQGNDVLDRQPLAGGFVTYVTRPHFVCDGGVQIWADSAVAYSADALSHLIGSVRYVEGTRELHADEARYFSNVGRLQAQRNVRVTDSSDGSVIENGDLVYLRVTDFRSEDEMTVTTGLDGVRPRATVLRVSADSAAAESTVPPAPAQPYTVVADRIDIRGGSDLSAAGDVVIERDSLFAFADSAEYEGDTDELLLEGSARVESATYDLVGRTVTMAAVDDRTDELRALRDAVLTGNDLVLTAPLIVADIVDGAVQRLVAIPLPDELLTDADTAALPRPVALAQAFELTADSLELTSPEDVLDKIFAAGAARSVSRARDSLNVEALPEIARTDWLEGDTIVVALKPVARDSAKLVPVPETESDYEVESIIARVGARSLYRLVPSDTTAEIGVDAPALHYVVGDQITIHMEAGEVTTMEVQGQTQGVHLEPLRATPTDTLPDSTAVQTDTTDLNTGSAPPGRRSPRPSPADSPARTPEPWRRP